MNQDFTVQKKAIFVWKKGGSPEKKIPAQAVSESQPADLWLFKLSQVIFVTLEATYWELPRETTEKTLSKPVPSLNKSELP